MKETDLPESLTKKPARKNTRTITLILAGIGLLLIGFVSGYYANNASKQASTKLSANINGYPNFSNNGSGGYGNFRSNYGNRVIGQVSSVNGQTIVITNQSGTSQTIQITSSTQFASGVSASQIAVGDTIMAAGQANSSGVIQATRIIINPSYGNGPASNY
ncbi:MAG TPA: DUF5666 domain-containing protein [Candidatus Saccharimonadales bacterium]|jgi:hypothetical protein|nr:DUF5666 domain-containing protein [Candidatus Saccharimonadales bacterium]